MFSDWKWPHNGQDIPRITSHWTLFTHGQKGTPHGYDQIDPRIHSHLKMFKFQVFGLQVFGSNKYGLKTETSDAASMRKDVPKVPQGPAQELRLSGDCRLGRGRQALARAAAALRIIPWGTPQAGLPVTTHQTLRACWPPCQHFSLFFLSQRFYFFLGKASFVRMACFGMTTLDCEVQRISSVRHVFITHELQCWLSGFLYLLKKSTFISIFATLSSFPSNLNRKLNVKDWAEFKYWIKQISVLLDNIGKVFLTFLPK